MIENIKKEKVKSAIARRGGWAAEHMVRRGLGKGRELNMTSRRLEEETLSKSIQLGILAPG